MRVPFIQLDFCPPDRLGNSGLDGCHPKEAFLHSVVKTGPSYITLRKRLYTEHVENQLKPCRGNSRAFERKLFALSENYFVWPLSENSKLLVASPSTKAELSLPDL